LARSSVNATNLGEQGLPSAAAFAHDLAASQWFAGVTRSGSAPSTVT
jgi:hypothetical protein